MRTRKRSPNFWSRTRELMPFIMPASRRTRSTTSRAARCAASAALSRLRLPATWMRRRGSSMPAGFPQIAPSLGGVESLIEQPALMSFYELTTEERLLVGIKDNLIRYSVGIEDADDLIADLAAALEQV